MYKILLVVHFPQTFQHNFFQHNFNYQAVEYLEKFLYIELGHHLLVGASVSLLMCCCNHAFQETNSLRRAMQIVECRLLHQQAQGRVSF